MTNQKYNDVAMQYWDIYLQANWTQLGNIAPQKKGGLLNLSKTEQRVKERPYIYETVL